MAFDEYKLLPPYSIDTTLLETWLTGTEWSIKRGSIQER